MRFKHHAAFSRSLVALIAHAWMALLCAIHVASPAAAHDDAHQIRQLIGATWDKPDGKVETDPVVISGNFAVASWTQGDRGGRALLKRNDKGWSVLLCGGDPLKTSSSLEEAGVPQADALRIAQDLERAEGLVPATRRAQFSLFEGTSGGQAGAHSPSPQSHDAH
jgi:hypothetical protein